MINAEFKSMMDAVLADVDSDIANILQKEWTDSDGEKYPCWYLINNPVLTVIEWQILREIKWQPKKITKE